MPLPFESLARHLGVSPDTRLVVTHEDDVGMCHGANTAFSELSGKGFLTCGSVMVPCPWFSEVATMARENPSLDIGVHLTLTSEWKHYRWRPLTGVSAASGLVDGDRFMWGRVPLLREHVVPEAAEAELRLQIEIALTAGIDVTHLDTHMGAALVPELFEIYVGLGQEFDLPVLFPRHIEQYAGVLNWGDGIDPAPYEEHGQVLEAAGLPLIDFFGMTPRAEPEECRKAYEGQIDAMPVGLGFFAFHCTAPGEIEDIIPVSSSWHPRPYWRTNEFELLGNPDFLGWVGEQKIHPVGMRAIRDWWRGQKTAQRGA